MVGLVPNPLDAGSRSKAGDSDENIRAIRTMMPLMTQHEAIIGRRHSELTWAATDMTMLPTDALRQGQWSRTENAVSTSWRVQFSFSCAEPEQVSPEAVCADTRLGLRKES